MKTVIILRSVSGAGKSTAAEMLSQGKRAVICCADDYFYDINGNYIFDVTKLGSAHYACQNKFSNALKDSSVELIIVANTNTRPSEFNFYKDKAEEAGALVFFFVVENRHGNSNIHNVPAEVLRRQESSIRNSLSP